MSLPIRFATLLAAAALVVASGAGCASGDDVVVLGGNGDTAKGDESGGGATDPSTPGDPGGAVAEDDAAPVTDEAEAPDPADPGSVDPGTADPGNTDPGAPDDGADAAVDVDTADVSDDAATDADDADPSDATDAGADAGPDEDPPYVSPCEGANCPCAVSEDCIDHNFRNDLCAPFHVCVDGQCRLEPSTGVTCPASHNDPCLRWSCDKAWGLCREVPRREGTPCDDGDGCTVGDACRAGRCIPSGPKDCDDDNTCTTDRCDEATGECAYEAPDCDDGDPCTDDTCDAAGLCDHSPTTCSDDDPCTVDTCDPLQGGCRFPPLGCGDDDPCTVDSCDPAQGGCVHTEEPGCRVTFADLNARLLTHKCVPCHLEGSDPGYAPKFVNDYQTARFTSPKWHRCSSVSPYAIGPCMVRRAVEDGDMPPVWSRARQWVDPNRYNEHNYGNAYQLTDEEKGLILDWVSGGMLE